VESVGSGEEGDSEGLSVAERPAVLYIVGAGRSGSTLFERLLGGFPGFVNVGELVEVFRQIAPRNERCGCGSLFEDCQFWQGVGERAFGGWDRDLVRENAARQRRVARQRYLAKLASPRLRERAFEQDLADYCDVQFRLYRAIQQESQADVIVDASKAVAPLVALRNEGRIDLRVLHLVRDVRGVSYSWAKSEVRRPHATDQGRDTMANFSVGLTSARWTRMEVQAALLTAVMKPSVTVRYEDLVADPRKTTEAALSALDLGRFWRQGAHLHGNVAMLPPSHGISGNPSRFTTGEVTLRADEQWRSELHRRDRAVSTALGALPLMAHGYFKTSSRASDG
jgi:hypothetical protein